jgi:hypothetical protein
VRVDGVDVALLVERLGPDGLATPGQDVEAQHLGGRLTDAGALVGPAVPEHLHGAPHGVGGDLLATLGQGDQLGEDALREGDVSGGAGQGELVATHMDVGLEQVLGDAQTLVARTQQREQSGVRNGHAGLDWVRMGQGLCRLLPTSLLVGPSDATARAPLCAR